MDQWLRERDAVLDDLRFHFIKAQQHMKATTNLKRRKVCLLVGDMVFLKLQPYKQQSLARLYWINSPLALMARMSF